MRKTIGQYIDEIEDQEVKTACKELLDSSDKASTNRTLRSSLPAISEKDAIQSVGVWKNHFALINNYLTKKRNENN